MTIWKEAPGFPDYEVSDQGDVRRVTPARGAVVGKILRPIAEDDGRLLLILRRDGESIHVRPSRLVCEAFHGPPPKGSEACHKDGNPTNNKSRNLRWDTSSGNKADMVRHGTRLRRAKHPLAKLTPQKVRRIKEQYAAGKLQREIADRYGIKQGQVSRIVNGKRW